MSNKSTRVDLCAAIPISGKCSSLQQKYHAFCVQHSMKRAKENFGDDSDLDSIKG